MMSAGAGCDVATVGFNKSSSHVNAIKRKNGDMNCKNRGWSGTFDRTFDAAQSVRRAAWQK